MADVTKTSALIGLVCTACGSQYAADQMHGSCPNCGKVLFCQYDLDSLREQLTVAELARRPRGVWRWYELLPLADERDIVTLGEGDTSLLACDRLSRQLGVGQLRIKDEGCNPTGSSRARGVAVAVSVARQYGIAAVSIPSLGNSADAVAAYAARAGLESYVFVPDVASITHLATTVAAGAYTYRIKAKELENNQQVRAHSKRFGWFDLSHLREPYRLEGEKTLGYELAEAYNWQLPDALIYPLTSVIGLAAIWKGWAELEALGWISSYRPRVFGVQAVGCAPLSRAFESGGESSEPWAEREMETIYNCLHSTNPVGSYLALRLVRESGGQIITVGDEEIATSQLDLARCEGIFASPKGAMALAGLKRLVSDGLIDGEASVVLVNPASGLKEPQVISLSDLPPTLSQ